MSTQSPSWYLRGKTNQPVGPFAAEQIFQGWRAGRLTADAICWREGMPQWLPMSQVEPFASAIRQPAAAGPATPPPMPSIPSIPGMPPLPVRKPLLPPRLIGPLIGVGIASGLAMLLVVLWAIFGGSGQPGTESQSENTANADWGKPVRIPIMDNKGEVKTTFLVGLEDGWYTDYGPDSDGEKTFVIAYRYKNLGPREASFSLDHNNTVEIKTDKVRIYSGYDYCGLHLICAKLPKTDAKTPDVRNSRPDALELAWLPVKTEKIDVQGEWLMLFRIPADETPVELMVNGSVMFTRELPQCRFGFRRYSSVLGFLHSSPQQIVRGLIVLLKCSKEHSEKKKDDMFGTRQFEIESRRFQIRKAAIEELARLGPAAKDALPTIKGILLTDDEDFNLREAAAKTLGEMGAAAKDAIPALKEILNTTPQNAVLNWYSLKRAAGEALAKIEAAEAKAKSKR